MLEPEQTHRLSEYGVQIKNPIHEDFSNKIEEIKRASLNRTPSFEVWREMNAKPKTRLQKIGDAISEMFDIFN